jgi:hypothetical protein
MGATSSFMRPVGAGADIKELEYVATLHQTALESRDDASIQGKFSRCLQSHPKFFISRHLSILLLIVLQTKISCTT